MTNAGDYVAGTTVRFKFRSSDPSTQAPVTLAGSPAIAVYKEGNTTEVTTGATLTVDYDAKTGLHQVVVDTSSDGTFYAAGNDFTVVLTAGTAGGVSVAGVDVGSFSIENRNTKADVRSWNGTATVLAGSLPSVSATVTALAGGVITSATFGAGAIDAAAFAQGAADKMWLTTLRVLTAGTNIVLAKGTGLTGLNDLSAAQVNTEADTALSDVGVTTTVTGRIDATTSSRMATFSLPTNFASMGINASGHISRVVLVDTLTTYTGNTPQSGDTYVRLGAPTLATIAADIQSRLATSGYTVPPAAAVNADAVWDEIRTGHVIAGSFGAVSEWAVGGGGGGGNTLQDIRDAMKLAPSAGVPAALSIDAMILALIGYVDTEITALATAVATGNATATTILGKLAGITLLANWLRAGFRNNAGDATAMGEIGGTYDPITDSQEAIRNAGGGAVGPGGNGSPITIKHTSIRTK